MDSQYVVQFGNLAFDFISYYHWFALVGKFFLWSSSWCDASIQRSCGNPMDALQSKSLLLYISLLLKLIKRSKLYAPISFFLLTLPIKTSFSACILTVFLKNICFWNLSSQMDNYSRLKSFSSVYYVNAHKLHNFNLSMLWGTANKVTSNFLLSHRYIKLQKYLTNKNTSLDLS